MTMEKVAKTPKAPKSSKRKVKSARPEGISIPGQIKYGSIKEALKGTSETLGILHVQTHDKIRAR